MNRLLLISLTMILIVILVSSSCGSEKETTTVESAPTTIDTDGDGWSDTQEEAAGTDKLNKDTDGDGYWDSKDPNPLDSNIPSPKTVDTTLTSTTTTASPSTSTTANTPPTTPPPSQTTIDTTDYWSLTTPLSLFVNVGGIIQELMAAMDTWGIRCSILGSNTIDYVYQQIDQYWDAYKNSNTIILFNTNNDNLDRLDEWPEAYNEVYPFVTEDLKSISPPFALLQPQDNQWMRIIIVVLDESDILPFLETMKDGVVPVGFLWTLSDGNIIEAISSQ